MISICRSRVTLFIVIESEEQNHSLDSEIEKLQDIVLQQAAKLKRYEEKSNRVLEDTNQ